MTPLTRSWYYLPAKALVTLGKSSIGKLKPVLTLEDEVMPVTVLDCFDQSVRQSGRLLLETGPTFELLTADGQIILQSSARTGQFVADFRDGPVKLALADISPLRSLLPIGSGTLRRRVLAIVDSDQKIRCRARLLLFTGSEGKGAIVVALQAGGHDTACADLRQHFEAWGRTSTGFAKLCAKVFPQHNVYTAKPEVRIGRDDTAFAAATDIISSHIPVARANEAGIIADYDTEFLHDYRITLRKIRSVLSLFKGVYAEKQVIAFKRRFSDLMAPTGRVRDLDVYLLERQRYYDLLPKTLHGGLDRMFILFTDERKVENARLTSHLQSKTYGNEISSLARLFDKRKKLQPGPTADLGAHGYASALIWERYRKIRRTAARMGPDAADAEVHTLRIHCKKLRYLMEFFRPLFPKAKLTAPLKALKQLQDNLGLFNDYAVQQVSLQDFLSKSDDWSEGVNLEIVQSVGALTTVLHRHQMAERIKVDENFAHFTSPSMQKIFRDLFHSGKTRT